MGQSHSSMGIGGQVSLFRLFCLTEKFTTLCWKWTLSPFSHLILSPPMEASLWRASLFPLSLSLSLSQTLSHVTYSGLEGQFMLIFHLPILQVSLSPWGRKPDRAGETWEGPLRQNCGVLEVYVLRQVSAAVARGDRLGWAGRGCSPARLASSLSNSQPFPPTEVLFPTSQKLPTSLKLSK